MPVLLRLSSDEPAVLGWFQDDLHLTQLNPHTFQPISPPRRVGRTPARRHGVGFYPSATVVSGRLIFTERSSRDGNTCHLLRVADEDGSDAHDAPWQLPCFRAGSESDLITTEPLLATVGDRAILVWDQRTGPERIESVAALSEYDEGIFAVVLTPDGLRGSEIVRVTREDSSVTASDRPGSFLPSIAVEGDSVVVTWADVRPELAMHVRFLHLTDLPEVP